MRKLLIIIFFLLTALKVQAAGLSVTPQNLSFEFTTAGQQEESIWVENISDSPILVSLTADNLKNHFTFSLRDFRLNPSEKKKVNVIFIAGLNGSVKIRSGLYSTNLAVVAEDLDRRQFNVATGVKIPIIVKISPNFAVAATNLILKQVIVVSLGLALILLAIWLMIFKRRAPWYQRLSSSIDLLRQHRSSRLKRIFKI